MSLAHSVSDAPHIEIRTTYAPNSHCPTSTLALNDDEVIVEGDLRSFGLDVLHRKRYERRGCLITDSVTGRLGTRHEDIVGELSESMAVSAVQLGLAA